MTVLRHEKPTEEYEVEIQKKSGRGAGVCFAAFRSGKGAYVSELVNDLVFPVTITTPVIIASLTCVS